MPTQRAASIPSGLEQQQWTGLRGLEKVQCLFAEGWARALTFLLWSRGDLGLQTLDRRVSDWVRENT